MILVNDPGEYGDSRGFCEPVDHCKNGAFGKYCDSDDSDECHNSCKSDDSGEFDNAEEFDNCGESSKFSEYGKSSEYDKSCESDGSGDSGESGYFVESFDSGEYFSNFGEYYVLF